MAKRIFDVNLALLSLAILSPILLIVAFLVWISSPGPVLHWSQRVGKNNQRFKMPKFRSMNIATPTVATDVLINSEQWLTPIGAFLRKTSLDELPQLWPIFIGNMSFVGPRPALFNQYDLIDRRTKAGIHILLPGLTGWAQIQGRDTIAQDEKISLDIEYLNKRSFLFDVYIISKTFYKIWDVRSVSH